MNDEETVEVAVGSAVEGSMDGDEVASLRAEIERLTGELAAREEAEAARAAEEAERTEFSRYYPDVAPESVPDEVRGTVGRPLTLAAAYALFERGAALDRLRAEQANGAAAGKSSGRVAGDTEAGDTFSLDEIRRMPQSSIRKYYRQIMKSLERR